MLYYFVAYISKSGSKASYGSRGVAMTSGKLDVDTVERLISHDLGGVPVLLTSISEIPKEIYDSIPAVRQVLVKKPLQL